VFLKQPAGMLSKPVDVRIHPARMVGENPKLINHLRLISYVS
jgi:hypothetical protein